MMATTSEISNRAHLQSQGSGQRRGAGIILAILGVLFLVSTGAARRAQAQVESVVHTFTESEGVEPFAGLVMDSAGNLYGTTSLGGNNSECNLSSCGTVFEVSTTPQGGAEAIATQVNGLLAQGVINDGQDSSLVLKLQQAVDMTNTGNINGAIGLLEGFIGEVNALENSGALTGAQGSALTSAVTSVVQQLQAM